jgi:hypothetical protein
MADTAHRITQEEFLADREKTHQLFSNMTLYGTIFVALIVIGMAIFLV